MARVGDWIEKRRETEHSIAATDASVVRAAIVHALGGPEEAFWPHRGCSDDSLTDLRLNGSNWHLRAYGTSLRSARGYS
jgi:hypothetical protein